jgi:GntP family gluconate:H+ symporter
MLHGYPLLLLIAFAIVFIVVLGTKYKVNPFIVLLLAALLTGIFSGMPILEIANAANEGFGNMMKKIGLVVVLGTLIGTILEKSGSILRIAQFILNLFGENRPIAAITVIGAVIGIPIFCDSGYIILSGLTKPIAQKSKANYVAIVCGLASGLYITHTLLPPHPGSIAGAANLGLKEHFGTVILMGLIIAIPVTVVAWWFSSRLKNNLSYEISDGDQSFDDSKNVSLFKSILPVALPLFLISFSSFGVFLSLPISLKPIIDFLGHPVIALLIGFGLSLRTVTKSDYENVQGWIRSGIMHAGSILIVVGAGGVFGEVLKKTAIAEVVNQFATASSSSKLIFLIIGWLMGVIIKTAQGSTTSAIIVVTSIMAPLATAAGFIQPIELSLLLAAIAGGTMMVSHTNDAYFWVISQFSGLSMSDTYRSFSLATVAMSITVLLTVLLLALILI